MREIGIEFLFLIISLSGFWHVGASTKGTLTSKKIIEQRFIFSYVLVELSERGVTSFYNCSVDWAGFGDFFVEMLITDSIS